MSKRQGVVFAWKAKGAVNSGLGIETLPFRQK